VFLMPVLDDGQILALAHPICGRADILTLPAVIFDRHQTPATAARRLAHTVLGTGAVPHLRAVLPAAPARNAIYVYAVAATLPPQDANRFPWRLISAADAAFGRVDLRPREIAVYLSGDRRASATSPRGVRCDRQHGTTVVIAALRAAAVMARALNTAGADHA
jgi:hypothetical protein